MKNTLTNRFEWFFFGYSSNEKEKLLYLLKRLFWLALWLSAVLYTVNIVISFCRGEGLRSLVFLIPIGISIFISLFFRFD
jgi:hypothetical protein